MKKAPSGAFFCCGADVAGQNQKVVAAIAPLCHTGTGQSPNGDLALPGETSREDPVFRCQVFRHWTH
jgi:hypothetical protein